MKRHLVYILILSFFSCKKNGLDNKPTIFVMGRLNYADPAADGPGWSIRGSGASSKVYIILESSIPNSFKKNNSNVIATLEETNIPFRNYMAPATTTTVYYYKIIMIKRWL